MRAGPLTEPDPLKRGSLARGPALACRFSLVARQRNNISEARVTTRLSTEALPKRREYQAAGTAWRVTGQISDGDTPLWLARPSVDGPVSAVIRAAQTERGRMQVQREIERWQGMPQSERIVELLDAWDGRDGRAWLVMPLGESLEDTLADRGTRSLRDMVAIMSQVAAALTAAGVVHRNLRPSNVLVQRSSGDVDARVADWGLSIVYGGEQPTDLAPRFLDFAAPQVLDADEYADPRDDLFSIGAMLWWACTGAPPGGIPRAREADRPSLRRACASLPALHSVQPVPARLSALVATLLRADRASRAPNVDGHRASLRWLAAELESALDEIDAAERTSGRAVIVGPSVVSRPLSGLTAAARSTPSPARIPQPSPARPAKSPAGRAAPATPSALRARKPAAANSPARPATGVPGPKPAPPITPGREAPRSRTAASATTPKQPSIAPLPSVGRRQEAGDPRAMTRAHPLLLSLVGFTFLLDVVILSVGLRPGTGTVTELAFLAAVVLSLGVAALDLILVKRLSARPPRSPRTRRLIALRVVIALTFGVVGAQAIMIQAFEPELRASNAQRAADQRAAALRKLSAASKNQPLHLQQLSQASIDAVAATARSPEPIGVASLWRLLAARQAALIPFLLTWALLTALGLLPLAMTRWDVKR
jgi:serine/threonine protein kinase